jgi:MFS family permease
VSAASLVGGLADTAVILVAAPAVQGAQATVLAPATVTLLAMTFAEGPQRVHAIAWWTAVGLAGGSGGNLLGGAIIQFASWRWILLLNVPLAAAAISRSTMKQS